MKVKTQRMSGKPPSLADITLFDADWKAGFDICEQKHKIPSTDPEAPAQFSPISILDMQADLAALETTLLQKYQVAGETNLPKNAKQWLALIKEYGSPLMVANPRGKPDEILIVIMDTMTENSGG